MVSHVPRGLGEPRTCMCVIYCAGGASLSGHSLASATLGAAASAPLLMLRASMWTKEAQQRFPVLEELQRREAETYSPIVQNMSPAQVRLICMQCKLTFTLECSLMAKKLWLFLHSHQACMCIVVSVKLLAIAC